MPAPPKKLVLLDAHAIIHRAYHALPDFKTSRGEPTGGLYGLSGMLIKLLAEWRPDYLAAGYDLPEKTFRSEIYTDYKSQRPKAAEDLIVQLERSKEIFTAFNIPIYAAKGFEADDIIGTIVEQLKNEPNLQIIIASGDTDTLQLVSEKRVVVYTLKRGLSETIVYDEEAVRKRFGFPPSLLPDFKGLCGDPSDNIIGVKGIGEKTAAFLIQKFGSLENIYRELKNGGALLLAAGIKERVINLLEAGEEEAAFSKILATIRRDAPILFRLPENWRKNLAPAKIEKLFADLEFKSLAVRLAALLNSGSAGEPDLPKELALAIWLLRSDLTEPTAEQALAILGVEDLTAAAKKIPAVLKKEGLAKIYYEIELPLIPIIAAAEERGILVDSAYLRQLAREYEERATGLAEQIFTLVNERFNINSPKQLGEILFNKLNLRVKGWGKTASGALSTRESELLKLRPLHPVVDLVIRYRELQKLLSTYIKTIPPLLDQNNRLHTRLNQMGTATGRMSSADPNLQNIPVMTEQGVAIRRAFVASPGKRWFSFDYDQIEMRVLALLSGDRELIAVFQGGGDIHTSVAAKIFNVPNDRVTPEQRRQAKVINFGLIYGMGVNALRQNLNTSREEAEMFLEDYFLSFPRVRAYFEEVKGQALKDGYTRTLFGRRRYLSGLRSAVPALRAASERMARNAPIQGTAADIVKLAMVRVAEMIKGRGWQNDVFLLLQVHDELIYEISEDKAIEAAALIKERMESVLSGPVPLVVGVESGPNWGELG